MTHWTPEDIPWDDFEPTLVDADIVKVVKAAAMVEKNSGDYAAYLQNIFPDDQAFAKAAGHWAVEEVQHGDVLGRWAEMADPEFDFSRRFKVFQDGYRIPVESCSSVRGSRSGELVARCVVEVGTSSYYTALANAADEPVLKAICEQIAADEFRHYKLFYSYLQRYAETERLSLWAKLKVASGRIAESDDDELAYAYYAANGGKEAYERKRCADAYAVRAYGYYRPGIVRRGVSMTMQAVGLNPDGNLARLAGGVAWWALDRQRKRLKAI